MPVTIFVRSLFMASLLAVPVPAPIGAAGPPEGSSVQPAPLKQIILPSDLRGAREVGQEGCKSTSGEFSFWVYATPTECGVPRKKAERVVLIRQPTFAVAPLTAVSRVPGGSYAAWAYGAGEPGHPWIHLCAKTCVSGELPDKPGWVFLGRVETRDNQRLYFRTWEFPINHTAHLQAVVLSASETQPGWVP